MTTAPIILEGPIVLLPLKEYESLMERLESLEDLLDEKLLTSPILLQELQEARADYKAGKECDYFSSYLSQRPGKVFLQG